MQSAQNKLFLKPPCTQAAHKDITSGSRFGGWRVMVSMLCFVCLVAISSTAMALDANEQAALDQVQNVLKSASSDLSSARSSAGTASKPATGSRLRLTQMRLSSATQKIEQATGLLGKLPAGDQAVKDVAALRDAASKTAKEIEAIISPDAAKDDSAAKAEDKTDAAGDSTPAKAAEPAKKAPRLHYQDEDKLKDARFHLRDAQGKGKAVASVIEQIDDEKTNVVYRQVIVAINTLNAAQEKLNLSYKTLEPLPGDHPKITEAIKEVRSTNDTFGAMRSRLKAEYVKLDKLANLKNYPDYDKDYALLRELSGRYSNFAQTVSQPEKLVQVMSEDGVALKEIQRIAKTYLPLVEQKTEAGENIEKQFNYFMSKRQAFSTELVAYKESLPKAFDADIEQAMKLATQGVEQQKPRYFGPESGIEQQLGFADSKMLVLEAFGKEFAEPYSKKLATTRANIKEMAKSLSQQIIDSNTMPPDRFTGDDREDIIKIAKAAWAKEQPDAQVLKVCIVTETWDRTTKWAWSNGAFNKVDYSRVQAQLIIKRDDKYAVIQPVNVYRDHLKGDRLNGSPLNTAKDEPQPHSIMLLSKVK